MILIGQYDSPFVRRVGVALRLYGFPFEHRPWSVFGDADKIRPFNPLVRVPVLVLDEGEALIESGAILDHLDSLMPEGRALVPRAGAERRHALRQIALATGLADKAVSLFYERRLHDVASEVWTTRCRSQLGATLERLDAERAALATPFWQGNAIGHGDIALTCAWRFATEAHPGLIDPATYPALAEAVARMEAMPVFAEICQPFVVPT